MVHVLGHILVVLAVVHNIVSQQNIQPQKKELTLNDQIAYESTQHRSFTSYTQRMQLPQTAPLKQPPFDGSRIYQQSQYTHSLPKTVETRFTKHPDEKIVHQPSKIYVRRPPTYVTINHPDIIIEPHPVVYHKPAAVVQSPVVYKTLPRKVQFRHVVKNVVKPIERKVFFEKVNHATSKQYVSQSQIFPPEIVSESLQQHGCYLNEESNASNDARENYESNADIDRPVTRILYQENNGELDRLRRENEIRESTETLGEIIDDDERPNQYRGFSKIYQQNYQPNQAARFNFEQQSTQMTYQ